MRILVVGATSEIAQSCCRIWANNDNHEFVFSGRDKERLDSVVGDFQVRFPGSKFEAEIFDHLDTKAIESFVAISSTKPIDLALIAHGSLTSQSRAATNFDYLWKELETNAISPIVFTEGLAGVLLKQGYGKLAVIGSVAGDRGRSINYAYGSGKAALETFVSGLQHKIVGTQVKVTLVKPGPTRTPMTSEVHVGPTRLADPETVAAEIVKGISKGRRVLYSPWIWRYVMYLIKGLPFWIFKRIKF